MNNSIGKNFPFNRFPVVGFEDIDSLLIPGDKILNGGLTTQELCTMFRGHPKPFPKTQYMFDQLVRLNDKFTPRFAAGSPDDKERYETFFSRIAMIDSDLHYGWREDMTFGLISHSLPRPAAQLVREYIGKAPIEPFAFKPGVEHKESVIRYEPPRMQIHQRRDRHGVVIIDYLTIGGDIRPGTYRHDGEWWNRHSVSGAVAKTPLHFPYEIDSLTYGPQEPKIPHLKRGGFKGRR